MCSRVCVCVYGHKAKKPKETRCTAMANTNDIETVLKNEIKRLEGTPVWQHQLLLDNWSLGDRESLKRCCFDKNRMHGPC